MIYMNDYQLNAFQFAVYPDPVYPYLALCEEAGEVASVVAKAIRKGRTVSTLTIEEKRKVEDELGDVLWQVAAIASDLGLTLSDIAYGNIGKLTARKAAGTIDSTVVRNEG